MSKNIDGETVARVVRKVRSLIGDLTVAERLEAFGLLALIEAVEHGFNDEDIAKMYDVMRARFVPSASRYREATQFTKALRQLRPQYIMRLLESRP